MTIKQEKERESKLKEVQENFDELFKKELNLSRDIIYEQVGDDISFYYKDVKYIYECNISSSYGHNVGITIMNSKKNTSFILFIVKWKDNVFELSTMDKEYFEKNSRSFDESIINNSKYKLLKECNSVEELIKILCDELQDTYLDMIDNRNIERKLKIYKERAQEKLDELKEILVKEVKKELINNFKRHKFKVDEEQEIVTIKTRQFKYQIKQAIDISNAKITDEFDIEVSFIEKADDIVIQYRNLVTYSERKIIIETNGNLRNIKLTLKDASLEYSLEKLVEIMNDYVSLRKDEFNKRYKE